MSKRLGGIIGCKYKTSSWHLNGFPYGSNLAYCVKSSLILTNTWTFLLCAILLGLRNSWNLKEFCFIRSSLVPLRNTRSHQRSPIQMIRPVIPNYFYSKCWTIQYYLPRVVQRLSSVGSCEKKCVDTSAHVWTDCPHPVKLDAVGPARAKSSS